MKQHQKYKNDKRNWSNSVSVENEELEIEFRKILGYFKKINLKLNNITAMVHKIEIKNKERFRHREF